MRRLAFFFVVACACSGGDFQVPPQPDMRVSLDLAANMNFPMVDGGCVTTACGTCSQRASWNGGAINVGDPCNWNGTWMCGSGNMLQCSSATCLSCPQTVNGTVCGADGHTIIELVYQMSTCVAYDWGSAIGVCNHGASDQCLATCTKNGNAYDCAAHCASDDGGGTGHPYTAADTCVTLSM